ncbi:MAG: 2-oxoacid:acceptor oxidoreductase family protein [Bacillota bacterium]
MAHYEIVIAGFGGQGVLMLGQLLAYAGMVEGKNVSYFPAYGPEMRGGTANCSVVISDEEVGSPVLSTPNIVIALNRPSYEKFHPMLSEDGILFYNSSLFQPENDLESFPVPANAIADELGSVKIANMVMLGSLLARRNVVKVETVLTALEEKLSAKRRDMLEMNRQALSRGAELVK